MLTITSVICNDALPAGWKMRIWDSKLNDRECPLLWKTDRNKHKLDKTMYTFTSFNLAGYHKWHTSNKIRNRNISSLNGNGKNTINIVHWNLGPRYWINKVDENTIDGG